MSLQLELHIPEQWPPSQPEAPTAMAPFTWLLRGGQGEMARCGRGTLADLPGAETCKLIIPANRVLLSQVQLPEQNRKKFMQALPYAVEDHIMADPESVHVAAGPAQKDGSLPVAIVERAWLKNVLASLQQIGIRPVAAETEALLLPWREGVWTLAWHGNSGILRHAPYGGMALDGGDPLQPPPGLRLALDEASSRPGSIQIDCENAVAPDITAWSNSLGVPVTLAKEQKQHVPERHAINLLQGNFAPGNSLPDWLPQLRPAIILIAVLAGMQFTFSLLDWAMLKYEKHQLTASMEQNFRSAFPDARVIVDPALQMRRNLAELRHAAGEPDQGDFLPLLASIVPLLGQNSKLHNLDYQQGILQLGFALPDSAAVEALRTRLSGLPQAHLETGDTSTSGLDVKLSIGTKK